MSENNSQPVIEVKGLDKRFGPIHAVRGISFNLHKGEVLGFLGPNGAGKSTTMKMITGFLEPTAGSVSVMEESPKVESVTDGGLRPIYSCDAMVEAAAYVLRKVA